MRDYTHEILCSHALHSGDNPITRYYPGKCRYFPFQLNCPSNLSSPIYPHIAISLLLSQNTLNFLLFSHVVDPDHTICIVVQAPGRSSRPITLDKPDHRHSLSRWHRAQPRPSLDRACPDRAQAGVDPRLAVDP
jgi:hypothetical protein